MREFKGTEWPQLGATPCCPQDLLRRPGGPVALLILPRLCCAATAGGPTLQRSLRGFPAVGRCRQLSWLPHWQALAAWLMAGSPKLRQRRRRCSSGARRRRQPMGRSWEASLQPKCAGRWAMLCPAASVQVGRGAWERVGWPWRHTTCRGGTEHAVAAQNMHEGGQHSDWSCANSQAWAYTLRLCG